MTAVEDNCARRRAQLQAADTGDLHTRLYAALIVHLAAEVRDCEAAVRQLEPMRRNAVLATYGAREAWRWSATVELQMLADVMEEFIRRAQAGEVIEVAPLQPDLPMDLDLPVPDRGEPL